MGDWLTTQKAKGALHALASVANGAPWQAYQQLGTDTRSIVTERMVEAVMKALDTTTPQPGDSEPPADVRQEAIRKFNERTAEIERAHEIASAINQQTVKAIEDALATYDAVYVRTLKHERAQFKALVEGVADAMEFYELLDGTQCCMFKYDKKSYSFEIADQITGNPFLEALRRIAVYKKMRQVNNG